MVWVRMSGLGVRAYGWVNIEAGEWYRGLYKTGSYILRIHCFDSWESVNPRWPREDLPLTIDEILILLLSACLRGFDVVSPVQSAEIFLCPLLKYLLELFIGDGQEAHAG